MMKSYGRLTNMGQIFLVLLYRVENKWLNLTEFTDIYKILWGFEKKSFETKKYRFWNLNYITIGLTLSTNNFEEIA